MTDAPLSVCPRCGGPVRKVFAPPAIAFKGSGFYATDHGKRKSKEKAPETKKPERKEAAKTDSKPSKGSAGTTSSGTSSGKDRD